MAEMITDTNITSYYLRNGFFLFYSPEIVSNWTVIALLEFYVLIKMNINRSKQNYGYVSGSCRLREIRIQLINSVHWYSYIND